jgi:hypothetical protein
MHLAIPARLGAFLDQFHNPRNDNRGFWTTALSSVGSCRLRLSLRRGLPTFAAKSDGISIFHPCLQANMKIAISRTFEIIVNVIWPSFIGLKGPFGPLLF